jgi:chromosome partitioning protein
MQDRFMSIPVIAVTQRKGGPGKTTLTRTLAEYFALVRKLRVLLIDFDTQCNLSHLFLNMEMMPDGGTRPPLHPDYDPNNVDQSDWSGRTSSAHIFGFGGLKLPYEVVRPQTDPLIEILPGDSQLLVEVEEQDKTKLKEAVENQTRALLEGNEVIEERYDVILIDTAPSASPLTRSALRAASHMLIPMELEEQCFEGMHEMLSMWRTENARRPVQNRLEILAIQANKVKPKRVVHQEFWRQLQNSKIASQYLSPIQIPDLAEFAERDTQTARPRSIFQLTPSNKARKIATDFGDHIWRKLFPNGPPAKAVEKVAVNG